MRTACVEFILADSYTVCSVLLPSLSFWGVVKGDVGAYFAQCPNRDHKRPPRIPPMSTEIPEDMPEATCTKTVPGHAPVSAIPQPNISPPITFPSYLCRRFKSEGSRGLDGAKFACFASSMSILFPTSDF